jgi:hypothetical protein
MTNGPTGGPSISARGLVGKALLASGSLMALFGLGIGAGWIAPGLEPRGLIAGALLVAAAFDVLIGLRFLGERGS